MVIKKTDIEDVLILEPSIYKDERGYFYEVFKDKDFNEKTGWKYNFHTVQVNESHSVANVLRGLHFQRDEHAQAKIVRCTEGCVIDFAVDIREDSQTFGKFECCVLSEDNKTMFFVPKGFAHGFLVISPEATFSYLCDEEYCKESESGAFGACWIEVRPEGLNVIYFWDDVNGSYSKKDEFTILPKQRGEVQCI